MESTTTSGKHDVPTCYNLPPVLIHSTSIEARTTIGIGMSASQKVVWLMLSETAWRQGVFGNEFFDDKHMLLPLVEEYDLWFLIHEFTRRTYMADLENGVDVTWENAAENDDEECKVWNLIFTANEQRKIEYTHLRGNSKLMGEKYQLIRQEAKDAPMGGKTIEFQLMTHNIFVDSPRNAIFLRADEDLYAALPDALKTEALTLKTKRDQAMQRAMAKVSDYLADPNIARSGGKVVIDHQIQGYVKPRDAVLLAMEKPKLAKGGDHADATSAQTSTSNFDDIATALKEEAKLLDAREEAVSKREVELAEREEDIKLAEAAKSLTLHAKSQATPVGMNFASSVLSPARPRPPPTGTTDAATPEKDRRVQPRDHGW